MKRHWLAAFGAVMLCGCASMMETLVPAGNPKYKDVLNAAENIPRGTPKWVVKLKLGTPQASGPNEWHYMAYGDKIAEAHIYFDDKGRVRDVKTNAEREFVGRTIIRKGQVQKKQ